MPWMIKKGECISLGMRHGAKIEGRNTQILDSIYVSIQLTWHLFSEMRLCIGCSLCFFSSFFFHPPIYYSASQSKPIGIIRENRNKKKKEPYGYYLLMSIRMHTSCTFQVNVCLSISEPKQTLFPLQTSNYTWYITCERNAGKHTICSFSVHYISKASVSRGAGTLVQLSQGPLPLFRSLPHTIPQSSVRSVLSCIVYFCRGSK
ncbi:hypothetical protein F4810DRAFT_4000 [Camillea tinctor]|nr:hypothetical protein F4810DRAFT_4000 [Camillea tinctor]